MEFNFDFDEDDPLVQALVKQRKTQPQKTVVDYIPKHDYAEWFHAPNPIPPSVLLQTKHGANHLKYSIEYHYAHGNHAKALELSLEFINFVKYSSENVRNLHGTRDLYETAARSAVRLGDYEQAVEFVNEIDSEEPGHFQLKAMVYFKAKRYVAYLSLTTPSIAAIKNNVSYLDLRKNDFSAWKSIGHCLVALSCPRRYQTFSGDLPSTTISTLALHSFRKSFTILTSSLWPNVDVIRSRYGREKRELEEMIEMLEKLTPYDGKPEMTEDLKNLEGAKMQKKGEENMKHPEDGEDERRYENIFTKENLIEQDVSEFQEALKGVEEWILRECSETTT
ncbi:8320_t:CDS:2 [Paraglomus occultum]|uniref:8320_t:CDS:1 n=1 Tax=Paraglomus occultum TaxID=144539 RepID=A0A9N8VVJ7_9GLOM|nr:8320_t:CDS:2 [Paraglomus occultum]